MSRIDIAAIAAEVAKALKFQTLAPAPEAAPAPAKDDLREKRLAALEKARAAKKAKSKAKPEAAPAAVAVAPVAKPAKKERPAWEVKAHTTKKGVKGLVVTCGPLSAWIPCGDAAKRKAFFDACNMLRTDAAHDIGNKVNALFNG